MNRKDLFCENTQVPTRCTAWSKHVTVIHIHCISLEVITTKLVLIGFVTVSLWTFKRHLICVNNALITLYKGFPQIYQCSQHFVYFGFIDE